MKLSQLAFISTLFLLPISSYAASNTSTVKWHTIVVGSFAGNTTYDPPSIAANVGDHVTFIMKAKNHSVTMSTFEQPCVPLIKSTGTPGVFSGFIPVGSNVTTDFPSYDIVVNNTDPMWGYCSQTGHCTAGMVYSINAPTSGNKTFPLFQQLAINSNITNPIIPPVMGGLLTQSTTPPVRHHVIVGNQQGSPTFDPSNFSASPGDTVVFHMRQKNHTVTQCSFPKPCVPLDQSTNVQGFHSGFLPVPPGASADFPEFEILINDSVTPIWGYCSQVGHCAGGMVFSINAPSAGNTYSAFQQLAIESNITNPVIPPIAGGVVTTSTPLIHHITVGGTPGLIYDAPNITVQVNEIVRFHMKLSNHTVTQSAFQDPCIPLLKSTGVKGFSSGFIPVSINDSSDLPYFDVTVNDTKPIWGYCGQPTHCQSGMVFSINAAFEGNDTYENFRQLAISSNITDPASAPPWGGTWGTSSGPQSLAASTTISKAKTLAKGALIGIAVGAACLVLFSVLAVYCCCCRKRKSKAVSGAGGGGLMGYGASNYRSLNAPAPGTDYEPLVLPDENSNVPHESGLYSDSNAYDPRAPPQTGQYSTAWDQHK